MARKANPNSAWSRMKAKARAEGHREGYYEAFDKWFEGRVTFMEKTTHGVVKGYRQDIANALAISDPRARIGGIRFVGLTD